MRRIEKDKEFHQFLSSKFHLKQKKKIRMKIINSTSFDFVKAKKKNEEKKRKKNN